MLFTKTIEKYKSTLEKTYLLLQRDRRNHVLFWVCSQKTGKSEVLSFDNFFTNEQSAKELFAWLKGQELLGVPLSRSMQAIEADTQAFENAVLGPAPKQRTKT